MKYELQPCSPKALAKTAVCEYCEGHGSTNPTFLDPLGDTCGECMGTGIESVNVGIEPAPEHTGAYPFVAMLPGQCFIIPFDDGNEKTIRNRVAVRNRIDQRKWVVIKHSNFGCYEVARVK